MGLSPARHPKPPPLSPPLCTPALLDCAAPGSLHSAALGVVRWSATAAPPYAPIFDRPHAAHEASACVCALSVYNVVRACLGTAAPHRPRGVLSATSQLLM